MERMDSFIRKKCLILGFITILSMESHSEDIDRTINKLVDTNKIAFQENNIDVPLSPSIENTDFLTYEKDGKSIKTEQLNTKVTEATEKLLSKDVEEERISKVMENITPILVKTADEDLIKESLETIAIKDTAPTADTAVVSYKTISAPEVEENVTSTLGIEEEKVALESAREKSIQGEGDSEKVIEEIIPLPVLAETKNTKDIIKIEKEELPEIVSTVKTPEEPAEIESPVKTPEEPAEIVSTIKTSNNIQKENTEKALVENKNIISKLNSLDEVKPAIIHNEADNKDDKTEFSVENNEINKEELKKMKEIGLISEEDYQILLEESIGDKNEEALYSLNVNGKRVSNMYKLQITNGKIYFPLFEFLEDIQFTNYKKEKENLILYLGDSLREVNFDFKDKKIKTPSDDRKEREFGGEVYVQNEEIYVESNLFESLFLSLMRISEDKYALNMSLNFSTASEIQFSLKMKEEKAKNNQSNELIYTNENKLFELGYARIQLDKTFDKEKEGKRKNDWSGSLEYQGAFLYGNLITSYDMKEKKIGNIEIEYPEIWKEHTLKVGNYKASGDSREWGLRFAKEKGYYNTGKNYVIREKVPIGSRVELIYMGFTLEIQDAEEGIVEFNNPEIKSDRTYELKIYSPDGKISIKEIKTADDYNQQNKNEIEYDVNIQEDHDSGKIKTESNVYYGITDNLTVGAGYVKEPEEVDQKTKYVDEGRLEFVYSDYLKSMPYTFRVGGEKTFNNYIDSRGRDFSKRYQYDYLGQLTVDKWKFIIEGKNYGNFYEEKRKTSYRTEYKPANWISLGYEYNKNEKYSGEKENESRIDITATKSYKKLMTTVNYARDIDSKEEYNVNFYYTGFEKFSTRIENKWKENQKGDFDYEAALTLYNNNYRGMLDYTISAGYSEKYKDKVTLGFTVRLDDWFKFTGDADKEGNQRFGAGIDKIVDLKNVRTKVDSMNTSRVRAITFIDSNNNNHYDEGEIKIDGVEVQIGRDKAVTDKYGEAMFYGVTNSILYDLKPTIKKPSFTLGGNTIKVKGKSASTIDAYIPIKPMVTLTGKIEFDQNLVLTEQEKQEIYGDILVKIKGIDGKEIELTMPDNTGGFDVSGLFPEKYQIEVLYLGTRFDLPMLDEVVKLAYIDDTGNIRIAFTISDKLISLKK